MFLTNELGKTPGCVAARALLKKKKKKHAYSCAEIYSIFLVGGASAKKSQLLFPGFSRFLLATLNADQHQIIDLNNPSYV